LGKNFTTKDPKDSKDTKGKNAVTFVLFVSFGVRLLGSGLAGLGA